MVSVEWREGVGIGAVSVYIGVDQFCDEYAIGLCSLLQQYYQYEDVLERISDFSSSTTCCCVNARALLAGGKFLDTARSGGVSILRVGSLG